MAGEQAKPNRLTYLGRHTSASWLFEGRVHGRPAWEKIPLLDYNWGMLLPNMIVVGDRRRVLAAVSVLGLKKTTMLHDAAARLLGPEAYGRVHIAVGLFELDGKKLPLTILETQMGCSAQEINVREVLALSRHDGYNMPGNGVYATDKVRIIRAGTCGGINAPGKGGDYGPVLEVGDIIVATNGIGWVGAVLQRINGPDYVRRMALDILEQATKKIEAGTSRESVLSQIRSSLDYPRIPADPEIVGALMAASREAGLTAHLGANHSKDSLYVEADEDSVVGLRTGNGVMSTEMEFYGLLGLANHSTVSGTPACAGLVSTVVGTIPGGSFAAPGTELERKAAESEQKMLVLAATALHRLAYPA